MTYARAGGSVETPETSGFPAAFVDGPGAGPRLGTMVLPERNPGTTLLAVIAAPLNPLDLAIASGTFHSARHTQPYVPGSECVGMVVDSDLYPVGTLVYTECQASPSRPGTFATRILVSDEDTLLLPDGLDPISAAAVGNCGVAAFMPLVAQARLQPGETVLVLGASGAVGQIAIQVARLRGAGRVIGVARDLAALRHVLTLGADAFVQLHPDEGVEKLAARVVETAGPVDVVLDGVYGPPLEAALLACAPGARVVNIGNPAATDAQIPAGLLRGRQLTLSGFAGLHMPLRDKQAALDWLWTARRDGKLRLDVHTYPLDELPAAWEAQSISPHVKCVIVPGIERCTEAT